MKNTGYSLRASVQASMSLYTKFYYILQRRVWSSAYLNIHNLVYSSVAHSFVSSSISGIRSTIDEKIDYYNK